MKSLSIAVLACLCALSMAAPNRPKPIDLKDAPDLFEKFVKDYNRQYKDDADRKVHYDAFVENLTKINEQNAKETSATFGINKFADYTAEEKAKMRGLNVH